ncbi:MAG: permease [Microcoleaceae cyanobacterium]|jgi:uncharacterized membrane protein YraQ (UPF0718 family)
MESTLTNQLNNAFTLFLSLLVEAIPFLLLGVLFSGILLCFINERKLVTLLPRHPVLGALVGSVMGCFFPVCECGNVPVARRLLMQGVAAPVAIGFLLAAPTINPIVIWATWTAFRDQPEIVIFRVLFSLIIATFLGWVFSVQTDLKPILQPAIARLLPIHESSGNEAQLATVSGSPLLQSGTFILGQPGGPMRLESIPLWQVESGMIDDDKTADSSLFLPPTSARLRALLNSMVQEFRDLGGVLVLGSAIAAAIQVLTPREWILALGQGPVSSIIAMLILASVVSICSTVDSFFALSFASTFTSGSLLAFLVFGPMIDIKGIGLMLSIFQPRAVIYLVFLAAQLTFLMTLFVNLHLS